MTICVCNTCNTPMNFRDMYCPKCHPDGMTLFEGVTKEAHEKLKQQNALLAAENERLRECVSDFMSIYYERDVLCQDGSGHVDRCRCRKCVKHRALKAMEDFKMDEKEKVRTVEDLEKIIEAAADEIADRDQRIKELEEKVIMLRNDAQELENLRKLYAITKDELELLKAERKAEGRDGR